MNRLDRALGILLLLSQGRTWSAARLAQRFEVSVRSIYRDVEALSSLGVPIVAERGSGGGYRLMEGFVLPPVNLTRQEAISLVLGVTILRSLAAMPYREQLETAEGKLLSVLPGHVRAVLERARELIGFERVAEDTFHPERDPPSGGREDEAIDAFLQAIVDGVWVRLGYASPYRTGPEVLEVTPFGLLWDRDRWYLVGLAAGDAEERMFRADRVTRIEPLRRLDGPPAFDVRSLLGRSWFGKAMRRWIREAGEVVRLRLTAAQADRLERDWYYAHALYEEQGDGSVVMTFRQPSRALVFELVRWLGPGAELLEPAAWRDELASDLVAMARAYRGA